MESLTNVIGVLFDNGNRLTYNLHNNYDIIEDRIPDENEVKYYCKQKCVDMKFILFLDVQTEAPLSDPLQLDSLLALGFP